MSDEDLIAALRKEVAAWFSNVHLLEFEELIRRFNSPARRGQTKEKASE